MSKDLNFDICFLDSSLTSQISAVLLSNSGYKTAICMGSSQSQQCQVQDRGLPFFWPSLNDPPTRIIHSHGKEVAQAVTDFLKNGIDGFFEFNKEFLKINISRHIPTFRVSYQDFERSELDKCVELGFLNSIETNTYAEKSNGLYIKKADLTEAIWQQLTKTNIKKLYGSVENVFLGQDYDCEIELEKQKIFSEICICNDAGLIKKILPIYDEILIPMSDILLCTDFGAKTNSIPDTAIRASSGHIAGTLINNKNLMNIFLSGPRFLLPNAGAAVHIEPDDICESVFKNSIHFHQNHILKSFFDDKKYIEEIVTQAKWHTDVIHDWWPCDELPIIGELGLSGRIIGSLGWLGVDYSAAFQSAYLLYDLILKGKSAYMHPHLSARRFHLPY